MADIPIWDYAAVVAGTSDAERESVRSQLYASQFRVRMFGGGVMTSSVDEARAILGLDDGDQVVEVFRAFKDAGGMRWSPQEAIHVELMPAEQYTKLAERPASLPKPPPDFDGRIGAMYYESRPPTA